MTVVSRIVACVASVGLAASLALVGVAPAGLSPAAAEEPTDTLEVMGEYVASDFVEEAAELPVELVDAIDRDLGLSAEQYLAESEAAVQASDVVDSLETAGVPVLGSTIEGTDLTVYVPTDADAAVVVQTGAEAIVGEPAPVVVPVEELEFADDIYGGQGIYWTRTGDPAGYQCSIGFNGYLVSSGAKQLATAGHCTEGMTNLTGPVRALNMTAPGKPTSTGQLGASIGNPVAGTTAFGSGADVGRLAVTGSNAVPKASVLTWGGGSGAPLSSVPLAITRSVDPTVGANLCRSGSRTGWRCGPITQIIDAEVSGETIHSIQANVCVLPGDSGGAAMIGSAAVGITSWRAGTEGSGDPSCATTPFGGFFPMQGSGVTVASSYAGAWEIAVTVSTPVPSFTGTGALTSSFSGSLANASALSKVALYIDGSSTPTIVSASSGNFSVPLSGLAPGIHSYRLVGTYGSWSTSSAATGYFTTGFSTDRLSGPDRYETGIAIVESFYSPGVDVLYVTTGQSYPDALSAGSAAVHQGGPVLLVQPGGISDNIADTIEWLDPDKIIVLGASNGVSAAAFTEIKAIVSNTVRLQGVDRYDTSRKIARDAFGGSGATTAFIANGQNFPDALSAGPAAATVDAPVVLVYGAGTTLPVATLDLLEDLGVTDIVITGSTDSVSAGIQSQLNNEGYDVERLGGPNRYETSRLINSRFFSPTEPKVFLASGLNYPDALAGSALAGAMGAPLFTTSTTCINSTTLDEIQRLKAPSATLLGGIPSLSNSVKTLTRC